MPKMQWHEPLPQPPLGDQGHGSVYFSPGTIDEKYRDSKPYCLPLFFLRKQKSLQTLKTTELELLGVLLNYKTK